VLLPKLGSRRAEVLLETLSSDFSAILEDEELKWKLNDGIIQWIFVWLFSSKWRYFL
jgi:hypothetical protein